MTFSTAIGDAQPAADKVNVASLPVSTVHQVEVSAKIDPINNTLISGKKPGSMMVMIATGGEYVIIIAEGVETTSGWRRQDNLALVTPA